MSAPYIPLYVADYLADTTHLTRSEHGAYLLLLMAMWRGGGRLPADDDRLARLSKCSDAEWTAMRATVLAFFRRRGGVLTHKRLNVEYARYADVVAKRAEAGRASAAKKAKYINEKPADPVAAIQQQAASNPNPNQNPNHSGGEDPLGWPALRTIWVDELIAATGCAHPVGDLWPRMTADVLMGWHETDRFEWRDVVTGVRTVLPGIREGSGPKSWRYFAAAIARARHARTQPTPEVSDVSHRPAKPSAHRAERNQDTTVAAFARVFGDPAAGEREPEKPA